MPHLSRFPTEVRDMIYELYFGDTWLAAKPFIAGEYSVLCRRGYLDIFLVSRWFYADASSYYHRKNQLTVCEVPLRFLPHAVLMATDTSDELTHEGMEQLVYWYDYVEKDHDPNEVMKSLDDRHHDPPDMDVDDQDLEDRDINMLEGAEESRASWQKTSPYKNPALPRHAMHA